jgi:hypothetical protein
MWMKDLIEISAVLSEPFKSLSDVTDPRFPTLWCQEWVSQHDWFSHLEAAT